MACRGLNSQRIFHHAHGCVCYFMECCTTHTDVCVIRVTLHLSYVGKYTTIHPDVLRHAFANTLRFSINTIMEIKIQNVSGYISVPIEENFIVVWEFQFRLSSWVRFFKGVVKVVKIVAKVIKMVVKVVKGVVIVSIYIFAIDCKIAGYLKTCHLFPTQNATYLKTSHLVASQICWLLKNVSFSCHTKLLAS